MTDPLDQWFRAELAATMRLCTELPREVRSEQRKHDRETRRELEERALINRPSTSVPTISPVVEKSSTDCAETGLADLPEKAPRCA